MPPPVDRHLPASDGELLIVGPSGGTHLGGSLARAAERLGLHHTLFDATAAYQGPRLLKSLVWHLARRPLRLAGFGEGVVACRPPATAGGFVMLATGAAPLSAAALLQLKAAGGFCINYSSDDPWNPAHRAVWHLRALKHYDIVFTPRQSNLSDFRELGCADVRFLPFGYDDDLFAAPPCAGAVPSHDVLFVGGADRDRAAFMSRMMRSGLHPVLVGGYWDRFTETRACGIGLCEQSVVRALTAAAAVNLCLVRRANRDGHVMRSFEIPAIGGFMIAEDTAEHREIFGAEGRCVLYFATPEAAADKARWALANPTARRRMAKAAHDLICAGRHTYRDRLMQMMAAVNE